MNHFSISVSRPAEDTAGYQTGDASAAPSAYQTQDNAPGLAYQTQDGGAAPRAFQTQPNEAPRALQTQPNVSPQRFSGSPRLAPLAD